MPTTNVVPRTLAPAGLPIPLKGTTNRQSRTPQPAHLKPAREAVRRTNGWVRGFYPAENAERLIAWESQLEYAGVLTLAFTPRIECLRDQPATFKYEFEGRMRRYTPDFRFDLTDGTHAYIEIKPDNRLIEQELARLDVIRQHMESIGERLYVITDDDLPQGCIVKSNLQLLTTYRQQRFSPGDAQRVCAQLSSQGEMTARAASHGCESVAVIYALIAKRVLAVDITQAISPNSTVSLFRNQSYATPQFFYRSGVNFSQRNLFGCSNT